VSGAGVTGGGSGSRASARLSDPPPAAGRPLYVAAAASLPAARV